MSEAIRLAHQQFRTIVTAILASSSKDSRTVIAHFNAIEKQLTKKGEEDDSVSFESLF